MEPSEIGAGMVFCPRPGDLPDRLSGLKIVSVDLERSRNDHLLLAVISDHHRTGPVGISVIAVGAPQLLACGFVQRDQKRIAFMIEQQQQSVAFERGPGAFAECVEHAQLDAEVVFPDFVAVEIVAVHAAGSEEGDHMFAVGDRRIRREAAVLRMIALMRRGDVRDAFPQKLCRSCGPDTAA